VVGCSWLARSLPLRTSYAIASFIGDVVFYSWSGKRAATLANMRQVLGPESTANSVWRTARGTYRNYLKYIVDFLRFPNLSSDDISRAVTVVGWENLDRALQADKGVIFVSMHFGHWDLAAVTVAAKGYPVNAVVDTFEPRKLNELIQRNRIEKGLKVIQLEQAVRGVLGALKRKEILGLLVDKPMPGDGVRVNFCGSPIEVPAGAATLAIRTGAVILTGYVVRGVDNQFLGFIQPHIEVVRTSDPARDVTALTQRVMESMEDVVRQYPDQWYMFRHMWEEARLQPALAT
jgi:phosphatidylinositol dimannoside acyltransferase